MSGSGLLWRLTEVTLERSSTTTTQWLHRLEEHTYAVKALAWCPFQSSLLATGGGGGDRSIKFWNTHTGACLNSVHAGSQVCALFWSKKERELLSSHGNHLALLYYPSLLKIAELTGHTSSVLCMAQSPDGCTVASAAGDQTLRFWDVFGMPETAKKRDHKARHDPFPHPGKFNQRIFALATVMSSVLIYKLPETPFKGGKFNQRYLDICVDCKAFMEKFKEVAEFEEEKEETKEASDTAGLLEKLTVEEKNTEEEKEEKPVEKVASADARRESC
ncbi:hypothetical protein F2Q68_00034885 [Brassica cretica]|uniref:Anaphase-promoting complex subunit 4 WD40 domain-containing protein n=1 Tax=Brassica cretica TaxID=69181 RepID=A0A8S9H356_BRACR|nr:hypothetical protein F2Q68_00034885 [Brassica cretica]